jgi:hypothetical protein
MNEGIWSSYIRRTAAEGMFSGNGRVAIPPVCQSDPDFLSFESQPRSVCCRVTNPVVWLASVFFFFRVQGVATGQIQSNPNHPELLEQKENVSRIKKRAALKAKEAFERAPGEAGQHCWILCTPSLRRSNDQCPLIRPGIHLVVRLVPWEDDGYRVPRKYITKIGATSSWLSTKRYRRSETLPK